MSDSRHAVTALCPGPEFCHTSLPARVPRSREVGPGGALSQDYAPGVDSKEISPVFLKVSGMIKRSSRLQLRLAFWLFFSVISVASLATLWAFSLEDIILPFFGPGDDVDIENTRRWRFIITSTCFAALSILIPGWIVRKLLISINKNYQVVEHAQQEVLRLARHDELTGLFNRRIFISHLYQALRINNAVASVMIIDLDNFKPVNDAYGQATGDEVLCETAERLREFSREGIIFARSGGDEFAVLISISLSQDELALLASQICASLSSPLISVPAPVSVSVSIGIAIAPEDATDPDTLLRCAGTAMSHSKNVARGTYRFYDPSYGEAIQAGECFEREIREAVRAEQFIPYFQPIVNLHTGEISGFEILSRWHHPCRGLLMPVDFISEVERTGGMPGMTESVLRQSCRIAGSWNPALTLSVNVPASMLEDLTLPDTLCRLLQEENFPLSRLEIEITEDALIANLNNARINLDTFRRMGISVSLDDFGTGYSGLYHLTHLSIDKIKIDRSFIALESASKKQMVDAILALGKSLEMQITAEGIEKIDVAYWLAMHGCDFAQGYLFGRPVPREKVPELFHSAALKEFSEIMKNGLQAEGDAGCHQSSVSGGPHKED